MKEIRVSVKLELNPFFEIFDYFLIQLEFKDLINLHRNGL